MAMLAMRDDRDASAVILLERDDLEVRGIYTGAVPTEMVDRQPFGNCFPGRKLDGDAMGERGAFAWA